MVTYKGDATHCGITRNRLRIDRDPAKSTRASRLCRSFHPLRRYLAFIFKVVFLLTRRQSTCTLGHRKVSTLVLDLRGQFRWLLHFRDISSFAQVPTEDVLICRHVHEPDSHGRIGGRGTGKGDRAGTAFRLRSRGSECSDGYVPGHRYFYAWPDAALRHFKLFSNISRFARKGPPPESRHKQS